MLVRLLLLCLLGSGLLPGGLVAAEEPAAAEKPKSRTFEFTYAATVTGLDPARKARLWVPVPSASAEQDVELVSSEIRGLEASKGTVGREKGFGNRIYFAEPM